MNKDSTNKLFFFFLVNSAKKWLMEPLMEKPKHIGPAVAWNIRMHSHT